MKNNKNRKRVLPLLLAMLLLIGAGAYGTRAFFSDQEALKASIKIETGKLDITSAGTEEWKYVPLADKSIDPAYVVNTLLEVSKAEQEPGVVIPNLKSQDTIGSTAYISNARPGDAFSRVFTFTNDGSLDLRMSFTTDLANATPEGFNVTFTNGNEKVKILKPGDKVTYSLTISVRTELEQKADLSKYTIDYMEKNLIIQATQPNAIQN